MKISKNERRILLKKSNLRIIYCLLLLTIFGVGCTKKEIITVESPIKNNLTYEFYSNDQKVKFKIYNSGNFNSNEIERVKYKTNETYDFLTNSIQSSYEIPSPINIYLREGYMNSYTYQRDVTLYYHEYYDFQIVHELTHVFLGGLETKDQPVNYLTTEGFSEYMEYTYGGSRDMIYEVSTHKKMKFLLEHNKTIPLTQLATHEFSKPYFRPTGIAEKDTLLQLYSYLHSASFISYLVDMYGLDKFSAIYNQDNLEQKLEEKYVKNVNELEEDWLEFIRSDVEPLSPSELNHYYITYLQSTLDLLDEDTLKGKSE